MTTGTSYQPARDSFRDAYVSILAERAGRLSGLTYRRDIRPMLPRPEAGPILDIGCGKGELVRLLLRDGYDAEGVDLDPEQVALARTCGLNQVCLGDYRDALAARHRGFAAVTATGFLEYLLKDEVLGTFGQVAAALAPDGVFVARIPNAESPFSAEDEPVRDTWCSPRGVRQLAAAAGFESVSVLPCPPAAEGLAGAVRVAVWRAASAFCKAALAAESGVLRGHIVTQDLIFAARRPVLTVPPLPVS